MKSSMKFPNIPLGYIAVYLANAVPPTSSKMHMVNEANLQVTLERQPDEFSYPVAIKKLTPPEAVSRISTVIVRLPEACYLVARVEKEVEWGEDASFNQLAKARIAEVITLFDLCHPGFVSDKIYEGPLNVPHPKLRSLIWRPEMPMKLVALPEIDHECLGVEVTDDLSKLDQLSLEDRERYRLAAWWFRRGCEETNPVNRFLFWYIVLEIYPTKGTAKVNEAVTRLLKDRVYQGHEESKIKADLKISRICRQRAKIVHAGKAFIEPQESEKFHDYLERLHDIAITCLRILAGLTHQHVLDKYISP